ncbi:hypothetical protein CLOSYM_02114 [[Clostridium] symbiosum ATCC 14940]|uniref:Uncharacterized protein n=1 Tax=[Clostridium] symbiosum ATCC 14940 TaxID=411472 RepID=A0ABC9TYJ8_CLOSY|nr:hypothetical protein CLOSYM_02114 [[Clostridium] symbiosum ATCC 14940]
MELLNRYPKLYTEEKQKTVWMLQSGLWQNCSIRNRKIEGV